MRFCGMCGTPLPHRPLTAPGAQSTLNFTRVPVDARVANSNADRPAVLVEAPPAGANGNGHSDTLTADNPAEIENAPEVRSSDAKSGLPGDTLSPEITPHVPVESGASPVELVPDVPLHEYVQSFRYEPPKDTAETSMRGDAAIVPAEEAIPRNAEGSPAPESVVPPAAEVNVAQENAVDVDDRLGLAPGPQEETSTARPRFLDLNEPVKETAPPANRISGPSFLGLSDAPQAPSEIEGAEERSGGSWRGWFAAAIVLLLVGLGVLEWWAQTKQTNDGPVEIIRTKLRELRHGSTQPASTSAAPASADTHGQPEIQVQEQTKPAGPPPTVTSDDPSKANSAPAAAATADGSQQATSTPPAQTSPAPTPTTAAKPIEVTPKPSQDNTASATAPVAAPSKTKPTPQVADTPKPKRPAADAESSKPVLGSEEMLKAKNASDSAAAAAWLWKATAKGNPDAPVELANIYIQGNGVPRSCEQAMVLLKTAAAKENAHARNRLAALYQTGTCVERNRVEAYRWMSAALDANPNSQWAQQNREMLWNQMSASERQAAQKYR
jgi:hypothetical protein